MGQAFRSESPPGGGRRPRGALRSERWAEEVVERAFVLSVDLPVGDRSVPPARCFLDFLGRPMSYRLFSWAEPGHRSQSPRDPGFMNPTNPFGNIKLPYAQSSSKHRGFSTKKGPTYKGQNQTIFSLAGTVHRSRDSLPDGLQIG